MIKLVEGAERQKTPNENCAEIYWRADPLFFCCGGDACSDGDYSGATIVFVLISLLVCLIPRPSVGSLGVGIAAMEPRGAAKLLAMSGRAVEALARGYSGC